MARRFLIWYWSATGGGGSQFAVNLAHRLSRRFGADAVRLSLHANDPLSARAAQHAFETRAAQVVTHRRRPLETVAALPASAAVLAEHARDVDCVIVPMNFAAAAPLSATLKKPLIYCAHDPAPHPGDYAARLQRLTQAYLLKRARHVVALSNYSASLLDVGGKLRVAPLNSVFEPRQAPSLRQGPRRLLFVGRMIAYKGLDLLAAALSQIRDRGDWRLTVAGNGPALTDELRARLELPQVDNVRADWLSIDELDALIAGCDVLLAPYRSATQSGVVAEALAWGKPVVATPAGALAEQVGDAGWLAPAISPDAFGATLQEMLEASDNEVHRRARLAFATAEAAWEADHWGWLEQVGERS